MCFEPKTHISDTQELLRSGAQRSDQTEEQRLAQLESDFIK